MIELTIRRTSYSILMEIIIETFQISCIVSAKFWRKPETKNQLYELDEQQKNKKTFESNRNHYYVNQNLWTQLMKFVCNSSNDDDTQCHWWGHDRRLNSVNEISCGKSVWIWLEKKSVKNQINSIRNSFSMGAFTWALEKKKKKLLRFCLAIKCPSHSTIRLHHLILWDKQKRPTKINKCQLTDYLGILLEFLHNSSMYWRQSKIES